MPLVSVRMARTQQTRRQYDGLKKEISGWYDQWANKDWKLGAHRTQLDALKRVLDEAMARCDLGFQKVESDAKQSTTGRVYADCRAHERYLVWVRRIWETFRVRFDQRNDARLQPVLGAADEIVWSCYVPVFHNKALKQRGVALRSAPLPFLDTLYAPSALTRDVPGELRAAGLDSDQQQKLQAYLTMLPIPVVRLPYQCVEAPWWLIYIGHEVGHHVERDLLPNKQFVESFKSRLVECTGDPRWALWGEEIFADLHAVCQMGPWAARAMSQLLLDTPEAMLTSGDSMYPPPVVRIALMEALQPVLMGKEIATPTEAEWLQKAGAIVGEPEETKKLLQPSTTLGTAVLTDLGRIPAVLRMLQRSLVPAGRLNELNPDAAPPLTEDILPLAELCGWDAEKHREMFRSGGTVEGWRDSLVKTRVTRSPVNRVESARMIVSAALAAYEEVNSKQEKDDERATTYATLASNTISAIRDNREAGTRAAGDFARRDPEGLGEELAALLMKMES